MAASHRIVVVGGGAGGVELVTRLGDRLGRRGRAHFTLIDKKRTHFWKPHLHQIAAGSMTLGHHELSYMAQGHWHGFTDRIGEMIGLNRSAKTVRLAPHLDEWGRVVTPPRDIPYDTLVICVGAQTNDFATPGVRQHATALETPADAEQFHRRLVNACIRAHAQADPLRPEQLQVAIIGAGATGVELAAELTQSTRELISYGLDRLQPAQIGIHLIEAAPRVLPALAQWLSDRARSQLQALGVKIHVGARVAQVRPDGVLLNDGRAIPAELTVWAAGIKGPDVLRELDGLATNSVNQLRVQATLQTVTDDSVFALGDCAACPWVGHPEGVDVPARAQVAHQQAMHLTRTLEHMLDGRRLTPWRYRDYGSLVSLGSSSTVGQVAGGRWWRNLHVEGHMARLMYLSLYELHQCALHGWLRSSIQAASRLLSRSTRPRVKMH